MFKLKSRILIVDDIHSMREQLKSILMGLGYINIVEAENGVQGFYLLAESLSKNLPFDLVISDLNMPELDGIELLKKIRGDPRFGTLPFLMLTAVEETDKIADAAEAGVSNYMIKPISASILSKKLQSVYLKHGKKAA